MVNPLVRRLNNFTHLSTSDCEGIAALLLINQRDIPARRDIIREGEVARSIFMILSGIACRYKMLADGRRQITALLLPGDTGDLGILVAPKMDHGIGALGPLRIAQFGQEDLGRLTICSSRIVEALAWSELVTIAVQREWTMNVGQRSAYERVGHLLCELFLRFQCIGLTTGLQCDLPMTQSDLGDATGLTPVHVNRMLREFRERGVLELQGRSLTIFDMPALRSASLFDASYLHLDHEGRRFDAHA